MYSFTYWRTLCLNKCINTALLLIYNSVITTREISKEETNNGK